MLTTLAAMAVLQISHAIPVQSGPCNALQKFQPNFEVELVIKPVDYVRNVPVRGLHKKMQDKFHEWQKEHDRHLYLDDGVEYKEGWMVSGSSSANIKSDIDVQFISTPYNVAAQEYCPFFKDVKITLTYQTKTTIGEDLRKDKCRFDVIHKHELKHNEANIKVAQNVAEMLEADLPRIIQAVQGQSVHMKKLDDHLASMREGLKNAVVFYQDDMLELVDEYDALIDTPEEFRRIATHCGGGE